jgi:hypothetical protein
VGSGSQKEERGKKKKKKRTDRRGRHEPTILQRLAFGRKAKYATHQTKFPAALWEAEIEIPLIEFDIAAPTSFLPSNPKAVATF